jgi:hypothetical protein
MLRAALFTLLAISVLASALQAQRTGIASSGHASTSAHGTTLGRSHLGGQPSHPGGSWVQRGVPNSAISTRDRRNNDHDIGLWPYGFPYDLPYYGAENEAAESALEQEPGPREQAQSETRQRPLPKAQLIELPEPEPATARKALPPTIFVLTNGERLESQRFLLTASTLSVSVDRTDRTIPLGLVDLDATAAANRQRGIDLRIPTDPSEVSLRF